MAEALGKATGRGMPLCPAPTRGRTPLDPILFPKCLCPVPENACFVALRLLRCLRKLIHVMKSSPFSLLALAALLISPLALTPAAAQSSRTAATAEAAEEAMPSTGVRFVICSPGNARLPSPLYCKQGKVYKPIQIGSRTPSVRVRPDADGTVKFWKENPMPVVEEEEAGTRPRGNRNKPKPEEVELPPADLTIKVPGAGSKYICIVVPAQELKKTQSFFLKESDFPKSGVHLINLSPYPLEMSISKSGDFKDKKVSSVGFFRKDDGISNKNSWSYKGEDGESVAFMLSYRGKDAKAMKRIKSSRFVVTGRQSQISIVVRDPSRDAPRLLNIQILEPERTAPAN